MAKKKTVYIFPEMFFSAWNGSTGIKVSDGRLEFDEPPTNKLVLELISAHGGVLEEEQKASASKKKKVTEEADNGSN